MSTVSVHSAKTQKTVKSGKSEATASVGNRLGINVEVLNTPTSKNSSGTSARPLTSFRSAVNHVTLKSISNEN